MGRIKPNVKVRKEIVPIKGQGFKSDFSRKKINEEVTKVIMGLFRCGELIE